MAGLRFLSLYQWKNLYHRRYHQGGLALFVSVPVYFFSISSKVSSRRACSLFVSVPVVNFLYRRRCHHGGRANICRRFRSRYLSLPAEALAPSGSAARKFAGVVKGYVSVPVGNFPLPSKVPSRRTCLLSICLCISEKILYRRRCHQCGLAFYLFLYQWEIFFIDEGVIKACLLSICLCTSR